MDDITLSIVLPGIRDYNWTKLYISIEKACSCSWELLICGPVKEFPKDIRDKENVKIIYDKGSPVRASNIAASLASGRYITWTADDAVYLPGSIDKALELLGDDTKDVVVGKYFEGVSGSDKKLNGDDYFKIKGSTSTNTPWIKEDWYLFNIAFMHRDFFDSLGGWDCSFEACPMAHTDMACRAYFEEANVVMLGDPVLDCGHMPGTSGDHAPIHYAQLDHDEPLFRSRYSTREGLHNNKKLKLSDWKLYPSIWGRRFK